MNDPSVDIVNYLQSVSSLGLTLGDNLHSNDLPDQPNQCVGVFDSGGDMPAVNYVYERPTIQVRVRGEKGDRRPANQLARNIRTELHGLSEIIQGGARYIGIWAMGDVLYLTDDKEQRPLFSVNFRVHRTTA